MSDDLDPLDLADIDPDFLDFLELSVLELDLDPDDSCLNGSSGIKCSVCCTGDVGSIPTDTCDRQSLGMSCTGGVTL